MATVLRSELSPKNKYYIDKHRYYELKHFCLQYPEWKQTCTYLKTKLSIPCGKDIYYDRYRNFFWLLDQSRE